MSLHLSLLILLAIGVRWSNSAIGHTPLIYQILESTNPSSVSSPCLRDTKRTIEGIHRKETWALKVLDSSGDLEPGFMLGNTHWFGSKSTCDSIDTPYTLTLSGRFNRNTVPDLLVANAPVQFQFRMVYAQHSSPFQVTMKYMNEHVLHIGLCVPASCSNAEVHEMSQLIFWGSSNASRLSDLEMNARVFQVKDLNLRMAFLFEWPVIGFGMVFAISLILVTIAHFVDARDGSIIQYFSPTRNLEFIFDTKTTTQSFPILFGIKSISCFVIFVYHTLWYSFFAVRNKAEMGRLNEFLINQWVLNGALLVDAFFVISGFLMSHSFLKDSRLQDGIRTQSVTKICQQFGKKVFQRYLRLMPLNFITMLAVATTSSLLADTSYFYLQESLASNCQRFWWRDLLFVQNFFEYFDSCLSWNWYLACEMQYFIFFLALLYVYARNQKLASFLFIVLTIAATYYSFAAMLAEKFVPTIDVLLATETSLYTNPFNRVTPYFVGVAGGWVYVQQTDEACQKLSKSTKLNWGFGLASLFVPVYLFSVRRDIDYRLATTATVLGRWVFSVAIMLMILTNLFGHQNKLTSILSSKFFVHTNKVIYAFYLLNPLVVTILCGFAKTSHNLDYASIYSLGFASLMVTYLLALAFTVMFEIPIAKLVNKLLS